MFIWRSRIVFLLSIIWLCRARQFCGSDLADVMALVCRGRGYNIAFKPENYPAGDRRFKRGIVDECCKRGCSWSTLETYCSPSTNIQIRKRSDYSSKWQSDSGATENNRDEESLELTNELKLSQEIKDLKYDTLMKRTVSDDPYKHFNHLEGLNRQVRNLHSSSIFNKINRNYINKEEQTPSYQNNAKIKFKGEPHSTERSNRPEVTPETNNTPIQYFPSTSDSSPKLNKDKEMNSSQIGILPLFFHRRILAISPPRN